MNSLRGSAAAAAMMLSFTVSTAAVGDPARDPREMMVGQYSCSTFPGYGPQTHGALILTGTSGLFVANTQSDRINVVAEFEPGGLPLCDAFAKEARTRLEGVGCTASQISAVNQSPDSTMASRSVQFVCSGGRDRMVDSLARLVELMVTNQR